VVLADASYGVLACMRTHKDEDKGWAVAPGLLYPVNMIRLYSPLSEADLRAAASAAEHKFTLKSVHPYSHAADGLHRHAHIR
jgi:hypothetical protein